MIPKNVREGATAENLPGEKAYFTIKPNGKAFRTLIDGLYSNKVRAVIRELCSNAQDSHIDSGQTKPFIIDVPTSLDPTFRVRDFGTSLSHQGVMRLYTTIFESTKEGTNEQTGQLGLGSKSPFAYTDTFSVIAYKDGVKRVYIAYLERDGVPSITHVGDSPSTEPQGLEVSFPAKRDDINSFQREMRFVAMGYRHTPPQVNGMTVKIPTPRLSGTNWAIYPNGSFGGEVLRNHYIRQGSVIYPLDSTAFPHVGYGWITVTDVPIGTAEVTASRESLSMDADTRRAVQSVHQNAYTELRAQVDDVLAKAVTRIDKAKVFTEYNGILDNLKGSTLVSLLVHNDQKLTSLVSGNNPGEVIENSEHFGKSQNFKSARRRYTSHQDYSQLSRFVLLVNDPETKVIRRQKRVRNAANNGNSTVYTYDEANIADRTKGVAWIKKCFELRDDQIKLVSSLPDCPPDPSTIKRAPSMKRVLNPDQLWMIRADGRITTADFGVSDRGINQWPKNLISAAKQAKVIHRFVWDQIFWVTEKQFESFDKKGMLPEAQRLDVFVKTAIDEAVANAPLDEAQTLTALQAMVGEYNRAFPVVLEKFFPLVKISPSLARDTLLLAEFAKIDLRNRPIVAKINTEIAALVKQYPLLFQKSDRSHYEHYVTVVQAASKS